MSVEGAAAFARFAYPPNALGYCGPADAQGTLVWADAMPAQPREGSSLAGAHSATGEEPGPEPDPEPGASLGRRLSVWLLSWFDLDWLL